MRSTAACGWWLHWAAQIEDASISTGSSSGQHFKPVAYLLSLVFPWDSVSDALGSVPATHEPNSTTAPGLASSESYLPKKGNL